MAQYQHLTVYHNGDRKIIHQKMEDMGLHIGSRLAERYNLPFLKKMYYLMATIVGQVYLTLHSNRYTGQLLRMTEQLDIIKFVCKEF
eukprot:497057-Amorphochlora_amoeboformis.AAC.2